MRRAQLFAARGIDGVSLREINRLAGQNNTGAVQYHFGDRDGLVLAVLDKHRRDTEPRRHALLDQYEAAGVDDVRALAAALVAPAAAKLADPDGGRDYLQISAEFYTRPKPRRRVPLMGPNDSIRRWHDLLDRSCRPRSGRRCTPATRRSASRSSSWPAGPHPSLARTTGCSRAT
jgi:AcrR family transcriptional regulator